MNEKDTLLFLIDFYEPVGPGSEKLKFKRDGTDPRKLGGKGVSNRFPVQNRWCPPFERRKNHSGLSWGFSRFVRLYMKKTYSLAKRGVRFLCILQAYEWRVGKLFAELCPNEARNAVCPWTRENASLQGGRGGSTGVVHLQNF